VTSLSIEEFLRRFFSPPNLAWPDTDPDSPVAATLLPFLQALSKRGECPVVLPRRGSDPAQPTAVYVVCWDVAHAGRVRALLEAAVAHHWCHFDGRVTRLDHGDSVDEAVLELVGPGTTFVLLPPPHTASKTFTALNRLVATIGDTPFREATIPRPIGRMLREFDLALATGAVESSASLLREIEAYGGISHENVVYLQIRRLAELGKDHDLLAHGSLPTLVYAEPPRLVREAILAAWARVHLARPLQPQDVDAALGLVQTAKPDIAMLVDESLARSMDHYVSTVCALVAIARRDDPLAEVLATNAAIDAALLARLSLTLESPEAGVPEGPGVPVVEAPEVPEVPVAESSVVESWLDWVARLGGPGARPLESGQALDWTPAWQIDAELAAAIDALPEFATDDLLAGVAAFLDADDLGRPAPRTAVALMSRYLVAERFNPYDLGAICALLGIFLRSGPSSSAYREVLGDVRVFAPQWVSIGTATRAIDLADVVVCGPVGDNAARSSLVATLLSPLNQQKRRLPMSLRQLAALITNDIALDYDWAIGASKSVAPIDRPTSTLRVLLYSLDAGALARVGKAIDLQWPNLRVNISSARDGNPTLKQHARHADLIVVATRRATHAATGFITDNAGSALIRYPDGSGSASMLRAVESGLAELIA
jgi:hypothetical protein